jgi:hypothetical protein
MSEADELLDLPEDPELAFVQYEKRRREAMQNRVESLFDAPGYDDHRQYYDPKIEQVKLRYLSEVMGIHDAYELGFLTKPEKLYLGSEDFDFYFNEFERDVAYWTTQLAIRHAKRLKGISTILHLTPEIRRDIHACITRIREIITPMHLPDKKKEAIFKKLNALADEIDRDRTNSEAWTAFSLEIASTGGQAAREFKPVKDLVDAILDFLAKAKAMAEAKLGLPGPPTPKKLEAPRKQLPGPDLDDEIPFGRTDDLKDAFGAPPRRDDLDDEIPF